MIVLLCVCGTCWLAMDTPNTSVPDELLLALVELTAGATLLKAGRSVRT